MLPGPDKIYECPTCKNLLFNASILSGNTFGEKVFSDGKREAFMFPTFPILTKCTRCSTFVWLNKIKKVEKKLSELSDEKLKDTKRVKFLTVYEYLSVLKYTNYNDEEEKFIRRRILWEFNDRVRESKPLLNTEDEKKIWKENIFKLMFLIDSSLDNDDKLLYAELNRNLGDFEKCKFALMTLNRPEDDRMVNVFKKECDKRNTSVFQLM